MKSKLEKFGKFKLDNEKTQKVTGGKTHIICSLDGVGSTPVQNWNQARILERTRNYKCEGVWTPDR